MTKEPHPGIGLDHAIENLGAAYVLREVSGDHYTAEQFQEFTDAREAVREIVRQVDSHCWNAGFKQGLGMGRSAFRNLLSELLAADDALSAFLIAADPKTLGEEEWRKQHAQRSQRKQDAIREARAAVALAEQSQVGS